MRKMEKTEMGMGYCNIERAMTIHKQLENGKWICISSNCSMISGQSKTLKKAPKIISRKTIEGEEDYLDKIISMRTR